MRSPKERGSCDLGQPERCREPFAADLRMKVQKPLARPRTHHNRQPEKMKKSNPVVVAGMFRSGTSLMTSFLAAMGLDLGKNLLPADANNLGYFEDQSFLELNRRLVAACCDPDDGGHADWGWTEGERFDASQLASYSGDGRRLLEDIGPRQGPWGFEDPRTTLLLDYWDELLEDARYVLVYRNPWDVSDSMQRLGSETFLRRPDYAPRIWSFYNRRLLDFYRRHPARCVLVSLHAVLEQPEAFTQLVIGKLGLELEATPLEAVYEGQRLTNLPVGDPLPRLFAATYPETLQRLRSLETEADLSTDPRWADTDAAGGPLRPYRFTPSPEAAEPPVAVVIPCRDHGHLIIEAIASVERSVPEPYELIIVDDGSRDPGTVEIMDRLEEAGYRIEHQEPSGVCAARNRGFALARAPYIIPLDADNRLRPGPFLAAAIAELEADPSLGVVYGDRHEFGLRKGLQKIVDFDLNTLLRGNYIDTCAVVRWTTWSDTGGYDEKFLTWEDWELWIRVARRGWKFRHLDQVAFDYRVRPGSRVSATQNPQILKTILERVMTSHREVFEPYLIQQIGHTLAAWPFLLLEECDRLRELGTASSENELGTAQTSKPRDHELQLTRARLAALQAAREADSAGWRLHHAKTSAKHFEASAKQLRDTLAARDEVVKLQQTALADLRNRAELAETAYANVKAESVAREQKLQKLQHLDLAHETAVREAEELRRKVEHMTATIDSRAYGLARLWWNLARKLWPGKRPSRRDDQNLPRRSHA